MGTVVDQNGQTKRNQYQIYNDFMHMFQVCFILPVVGSMPNINAKENTTHCQK